MTLFILQFIRLIILLKIRKPTTVTSSRHSCHVDIHLSDDQCKIHRISGNAENKDYKSSTKWSRHNIVIDDRIWWARSTIIIKVYLILAWAFDIIQRLFTSFWELTIISLFHVYRYANCMLLYNISTLQHRDAGWIPSVTFELASITIIHLMAHTSHKKSNFIPKNIASVFSSFFLFLQFPV